MSAALALRLTTAATDPAAIDTLEAVLSLLKERWPTQGADAVLRLVR